MKATLLPILLAFAGGILATLLTQLLLKPPQATPDIAAPEKIQTASPKSTPTLVSQPSANPGTTSLLEAEWKGKKEAIAAAATKQKTLQINRGDWQKRWREQMRERTEEQDRIRITYLADALGLTPAQIEALRASIEASPAAGITATAGGNLFRFSTGAEAGDPLETLLAETLTPEQVQAYGELKAKVRSNKIEARTMQRFARLPDTLNLTEEQKDRVFEIFAAAEAKQFDEQPAGGGNVGAFTTAMSSGTSFVFAQGGGTADPTTVQRNEERVEALRPVLDERQLEAYRSHVENRNGIVGPNIQIGVSSTSGPPAKASGD